ncbi:MAG: preprotein translocase subunit YajC [Myxococcales bacterium]|nr:preprotein translocase subunit YajC [Myxococcales bacterium]
MLAPLCKVAFMAVAQSPGAPQPGGCLDPASWLLPVVIAAIMYFVWLRPAQNDRRKHQQLLDSLKRGDEVLMQSGILGTIADMDEKTVTLEVARNVKVRFLRGTVVRKMTAPAESDSSKSSKSS